MRVETAFNRVLALPGAVVSGVLFTDEGVIAQVRRRRRRHVCPCGWSTRARYDISRRRWRHLDLGSHRVWLEAEIARIECRSCGRVRTEDVPWARPGARCSRDFEDTIGWLAQRMDKSAIATLMRCAWRTVDATVKRLVGEHLDADVNTTRLDGLVRLGVDEISYKRGHSYLTVVADHDTGRVVWVAKGRSARAFEDFTVALGPQRCAEIEAVTMDMSHIYRGAVERTLPQAQICFDPFHVIKWANEALEQVLAAVRASIANGANGTSTAALTSALGVAPDKVTDAGRSVRARTWRRARFLLRAGAERLTDQQQELLAFLRSQDLNLARGWELKEGLRDLYQNLDLRADPGLVPRYLHAWCDAAEASRLRPFITLARRIRAHFTGITAAVQLGLSNSRLEGINAKIRVIQRRGYGHPDPDALAAMVHLCIGGITVPLPTRT